MSNEYTEGERDVEMPDGTDDLRGYMEKNYPPLEAEQLLGIDHASQRLDPPLDPNHEHVHYAIKAPPLKEGDEIPGGWPVVDESIEGERDVEEKTTYAHDWWCNTDHDAGPGKCPPAEKGSPEAHRDFPPPPERDGDNPLIYSGQYQMFATDELKRPDDDRESNGPWIAIKMEADNDDSLVWVMGELNAPIGDWVVLYQPELEQTLIIPKDRIFHIVDTEPGQWGTDENQGDDEAVEAAMMGFPRRPKEG